MGKMLDNVRAWWNDTSENLGDPGKLAQLSVADLEKSIKSAKEAAAPIIGKPVVLESRLKDTKKSDEELTEKITALIKSGDEGKEAAKKYIERQVEVRKQITEIQAEYDDAKEASEQWTEKIHTLENELYKRRNDANRLQAEYQSAKAEQQLGKQMQSADSILGSDNFDSIQARVDKEKAKAAGYNSLSGLDDKVKEDEIIKNSEVDNLMNDYLNKIN